jgi:hypothetical protein
MCFYTFTLHYTTTQHNTPHHTTPTQHHTTTQHTTTQHTTPHHNTTHHTTPQHTTPHHNTTHTVMREIFAAVFTIESKLNLWGKWFDTAKEEQYWADGRPILAGGIT